MSYVFDHEVEWPSQLKLLYTGTDTAGFGLLTDSASIKLSVPGGPEHHLTGKIENPSLILAALPSEMQAGWYDTALTVRDATGTVRDTGERLRLPFGIGTNVELAVVPVKNPPNWAFGEPIDIKITEPVGAILSELGLTNPGDLRPKLMRTDSTTEFTGGFGKSQIVDAGTVRNTIRLQLPSEPYVGYSPDQTEHYINPGIPKTVLDAPNLSLPTFYLIPPLLQLTDVEALIKAMFKVTPTPPRIEPAKKPQWSISGVPGNEITGIADMTPAVLWQVKEVVFGDHSTVTVDLSCSISEEGATADETGLSGPPWKSGNTTVTSGALSPRAISFDAVFGLLRPRVVAYKGDAWSVDGSFKATLKVSVTVRNLPEPLPSSHVVDLEVPVENCIIQLPLRVPSFAVLTDQRYEGSFPSGTRALVLLDDVPSLKAKDADPTSSIPVQTSVFSTTSSNDAEPPLKVLLAALRLAQFAIPELGKVFRGFPGAASDRSGLDQVISLLEDPTREITVTGMPSYSDFNGTAFTGHPRWADKARAAFLVGLRVGNLAPRTLRVFSEPKGSTTSSAYFDMRVPVGCFIGSLWTLHESLFQNIGARSPFTRLTEPDPWTQWRDAENRSGRHNMPWSLKGSHFGEVISGYQWVPTPEAHVSYQAINYPTYFVRHRNFLGELTQIPFNSELDRRDATFRVVPGLAGSGISIQATNFPGYYLRHQGFRLKLQSGPIDSLFRNDATFLIVPGLANSSKLSFRSLNYASHYIRHRGFHLYLEKGSDSLFRQDATFAAVSPKWQL